MVKRKETSISPSSSVRPEETTHVPWVLWGSSDGMQMFRVAILAYYPGFEWFDQSLDLTSYEQQLPISSFFYLHDKYLTNSYKVTFQVPSVIVIH